MKIYGYGEDALTLWALTTRTDEILRQLRDTSGSEDALLLYRPSFGRGGSGQFGEFDAVLATSQAIYLIEAKWTGSQEVRRDGTVILRKKQTDRHQIFRRRLEQWQKDPASGTDSFSEDDGLVLINAGSRLAANLHHIFSLLGSGNRPLINVLLYLRISGDQRSRMIPPDGFQPVELACDGAGFVELGARLVTE